MQTPAQRYRRSERVYQSEPLPWQYPEGFEVLRVDADGMIPWERDRYFVCESLIQHEVAAEQIGGELLVRFRNMYIRQINLETNRTSPFIHPVTDI